MRMNQKIQIRMVKTMAKFTISILDKLIENSNNKDLTDFQNLTDVSKTTLFGSELNVISEEYRDRFVLSFTQEFLYDEIGFVPRYFPAR